MARTERVFEPCSEMRGLAEKLVDALSPWVGFVETDLIRFDLITSEQAKNSSDVFVDELTKDWLKQETPRRWVIAFYSEKWDGWDVTRKQWEVFEALLKVAKIKPDIVGYRFVFDGLRHMMQDALPEVDWRRANDNYGAALPNLLADSTQEALPRLEEYESHEEYLIEDTEAAPTPRALKG